MDHFFGRRRSNTGRPSKGGDAPSRPAPSPAADVDLSLLSDKAYFDFIYRRHIAYVARLFGHLVVRDDAEIDDLVQIAFIVVLRRLPERDRGTETDATIRPWLRAICIRVLADRRRTRKAKPTHDGDDLEVLPDSAQSPESEGNSRERVALVGAALGKLTPPSEQVIVMRFVHLLDVEKIAETLGIAESTVKTRIASARDELRKVVDKMPALRGRAGEAKNAILRALDPRDDAEQALQEYLAPLAKKETPMDPERVERLLAGLPALNAALPRSFLDGSWRSRLPLKSIGIAAVAAGSLAVASYGIMIHEPVAGPEQLEILDAGRPDAPTNTEARRQPIDLRLPNSIFGKTKPSP
jgi:RNA polymerase sigma-70 factor, ECF subfamily